MIEQIRDQCRNKSLTEARQHIETLAVIGIDIKFMDRGSVKDMVVRIMGSYYFVECCELATSMENMIDAYESIPRRSIQW